MQKKFSLISQLLCILILNCLHFLCGCKLFHSLNHFSYDKMKNEIKQYFVFRCKFIHVLTDFVSFKSVERMFIHSIELSSYVGNKTTDDNMLLN